MAARHLGPRREARLSDEMVTSPGHEPQPTATSEDDGDPADLWSLPHDVVVAPPATDTLVAAWTGALVPGAGVDSLPRHDPGPDGPTGRNDEEPDAGEPRRELPRTTRNLAMTLLVSLGVSVVVGLAALPLIGLLAADLRAGAQAPAPTGSTAVDDRVVVQGPSDGCLTMLVKPRKDGTATDSNGTCFAVG